MGADNQQLQESIGYHFTDQALLNEALTHPSVTAQQNAQAKNYQRLEFLGDSVLNLIIAEALYAQYPDAREGKLAQARGILTGGAFLSQLGQELNIQEYIQLSTAEEASNTQMRPAVIEDAIESLVGAIFIDSDYITARAVVLNLYPDLNTTLEAATESFNPKGKLQEWYQQKYSKNTLHYKVTDEQGPDHNKTFTVSLYADDQFLAKGTGSSKKEAEEAAARKALEDIPQD